MHIFLILLLAFSSIYALTLEKLLDNAISKNMKIIEKQKRYEEIYYDTQIAKSGYLPKLDLTLSTPIYNSRESSYNNTKYDLELRLTQNIFNGFKDINKINLELSKYGSALYSTKELTNSFSLEIISLYINVIREKEILKIQNSSILNHEDIFKKIKLKYNSGLGTKLEYRLSNTSLTLAKINYDDQEHSLQQVVNTLEKHINNSVDVDSLEIPNMDVYIPLTANEAIEIAIKSHPSLFIAKLNKKMSDYEILYTKKDLYPSLDFKANYYTGENNIYKSIDKYYDVYLQLSYNLYSGGSDINAKRKMDKKNEQKNALIEDVRRNIVHKIKSKYYFYLLQKKKNILLDEYLLSKELVLKSYYSEFSIGKANLRDILDTTESLYNAKRILTDGRFKLLKSKYDILEAMGSLPNIKYNTIMSNKNNLIYKEDKELQHLYVVTDNNKYKTDKSYMVTATRLNIREDKSTDSLILAFYHKGELINVIKSEGFWMKTDIGWVHKDYLKEVIDE